jgi:hypothetical protein
MISGVGGVGPDGAHWFLSIEEAVAGIQRGDWLFIIYDGGRYRWIVMREKNSCRYLRTEVDDLQPDPLFKLPERP